MICPAHRNWCRDGVVPVAIVTGDYFLAEPIQYELRSLGASIRFKPLWLEDLIALAKTLINMRPA